MSRRNNTVVIVASMLLLTAYSCSSDTKQDKDPAPAAKTPAVKSINGVEQFKTVVDNAGDRLLVFDLYADWCMPCKILSPMLEEIAQARTSQADFYKINIDQNQELAGAFGVQGIPYVVFVKNKTAVHAFTGVQNKGAYERAIDQFAGGSQLSGTVPGDRPNGEIMDGIRVIELSSATSPGTIYVYRGDEVRLVIERVDFPYAISIPQYGINSEAKIGEKLEVTFKAAETGVFPIFCNGQCPAGDGSRYGQITVMDFKSDGGATFQEMTARQFSERVGKEGTLLLDVRTPNEYYSEHIKGATLIPLQQLEQRISEIAMHKNSEILLYCRSGNRSTVAAQILKRHGFTKLSNLRPGIIGWRKEGLPIEKK